MTKAKSKPCICCTHYSGGIPCQKGHKPRMFLDGGLRRVCDDFSTHLPTTKMTFINRVKRLFGVI